MYSLVQKQPCYKEGKSFAVDSDIPLFSEDEFTKLINSEAQQKLTWKNYWVDIGEGRKYKGQWLTKADPMATKADQDNRQGPSTDINQVNKEIWMGFGTI